MAALGTINLCWRYRGMERCAECGGEANVVILEAGMAVAYCSDHHPCEPSAEDRAYLEMAHALDDFRG